MLTGDQVWNPTAITQATADVTEEDVERSFTPEFGTKTPEFGHQEAREVVRSCGKGSVLLHLAETYPRCPACVMSEPISESLLVGDEMMRRLPRVPMRCGPCSFYAQHDARGHNFAVGFPRPIRLEG